MVLLSLSSSSLVLELPLSLLFNSQQINRQSLLEKWCHSFRFRLMFFFLYEIEYRHFRVLQGLLAAKEKFVVSRNICSQQLPKILCKLTQVTYVPFTSMFWLQPLNLLHADSRLFASRSILNTLRWTKIFNPR